MYVCYFQLNSDFMRNMFPENAKRTLNLKLGVFNPRKNGKSRLHFEKMQRYNPAPPLNPLVKAKPWKHM